MTLKVDLCGIELKNPVIPASGTFGFGREFSAFYDLDRLGAICTKGLKLYPTEGNRGRRIHETASGLMNSIGLQNPGVDAFIEEDLVFLKRYETPIIANVGGEEIEDYLETIRRLEDTSVAMIELNISCPNVKKGGMSFGIKAQAAKEIVLAARSVTAKPLMVKLSPNAENLVDMAQACVESGADALSLVNTFNALAIDTRTRKPIFNNITAGLSGPAIKPIALRMVWEVAQAVDVPVVGMGGIATADDVLQFIMAGATAVQVGTMNFVEPMTCIQIIEDLEVWCKKHGVNHLSEIRGCIGGKS